MHTNQIHEPIARAALLAQEPAPEHAKTAATGATVKLKNVSGKVAIAWTDPSSVGRWDYVALFDKAPAKPPNNYMRRQWEYVSDNDSPFVSKYDADGETAYWAAYCSWDYDSKQYVIVAQIGPQTVA